ncbi:MAG: hypothetical protein P8M80_05380, partial [Pirellulaceae bacterium]|nr:hypothetical protein [Pirellulaceae bacterium]
MLTGSQSADALIQTDLPLPSTQSTQAGIDPHQYPHRLGNPRWLPGRTHQRLDNQGWTNRRIPKRNCGARKKKIAFVLRKGDLKLFNYSFHKLIFVDIDSKTIVSYRECVTSQMLHV